MNTNENLIGKIPSHLLEKWKIKVVSCGQDKADGKTKDRKYFTPYATPIEEEGIIGSVRERSRNFHETGMVIMPDGTSREFRASSFYNNAIEMLGGDNLNWINTPPRIQSETFKKLIGAKFKAKAITHYCEEFRIPNSVAKNPNQYQATMLVLEDEDIETIFAQNNRFIINPNTSYGRKRIEQVQMLQAKARAENTLAKNERLKGEGSLNLLTDESVKQLMKLASGVFDREEIYKAEDSGLLIEQDASNA